MKTMAWIGKSRDLSLAWSFGLFMGCFIGMMITLVLFQTSIKM
jgi:hypothetical protein